MPGNIKVRRYFIALALAGVAAVAFLWATAYHVSADSPRAREILPQYFRGAVGPKAAHVYVWHEPGFMESSTFIQFETTDSTIVLDYMATPEGRSMSPDPAGGAQYRANFPSWFRPPRAAEGGEYFHDAAGRHHLWTSADKHRVWYYLFSF